MKIKMYDEPFFNINHYFNPDIFFHIYGGGRNIGKTFSSKLFFLERSLASDAPFIFIVREVGEGQGCAETMFDNIQLKGFYNDIEFKVREFKPVGYAVYYNDKEEISHEICYVIALKKSNSVKRMSLEHTCGMLFDEFIPEIPDYLPNECNALLSIYVTALRQRSPSEFPCILIGNIITYECPYLSQWDLSIPKVGEFELFHKMKGGDEDIHDVVVFYNFEDGKFSKGEVGNIISVLSKSYDNVVRNNSLEVLPICEYPNDCYKIISIKMGNACFMVGNKDNYLFTCLCEPDDDTYDGITSQGERNIISVALLHRISMIIKNSMQHNRIFYNSNRCYGVVMEFIRNF